MKNAYQSNPRDKSFADQVLRVNMPDGEIGHDAQAAGNAVVDGRARERRLALT